LHHIRALLNLPVKPLIGRIANCWVKCIVLGIFVLRDNNRWKRLFCRRARALMCFDHSGWLAVLWHINCDLAVILQWFNNTFSIDAGFNACC
uniref:Transposase n=1 Tax=Haemonchus placei TaxID=6290 RepID=A0A0N4X895_HAEPC